MENLNNRNVLFVVDLQYDFLSANGSLYVNGGEDVAYNIVQYIKEHNIDEVILTVDWHTSKDKSFKVNGGTWPIHCVQHSEGAAIYTPLIDMLIEENIPYQIFEKGSTYDHEEYGAFERHVYDNSYNHVFINYGFTSDGIVIKNTKNTNFYICGLAGDYCVFQTWRNLKKWGINAKPIDDCIGWINKPFDYEKRNKELLMN